jgi:peptidylprolyl isomerase
MCDGHAWMDIHMIGYCLELAKQHHKLSAIAQTHATIQKSIVLNKRQSFSEYDGYIIVFMSCVSSSGCRGSDASPPSAGCWSSRGEPRLIKPDAVVSCRFEIQLNDTECPRAVKNFKSLCEGTVDKHGKDLHYQNTMFHRFVKDFCLQGGDINGKGGDSIYSGFFKDEKGGLKRKHDHVGVVSMANSGPHTNRSQFFFTLSKDGCQSCDGKHVVVGRVVNDEALRFLMENVNETLQADDGEVPTTDVFISSCGIAHCK